jgi:hypothetical protein
MSGLAVTELGILYQKTPEHGVKEPNKEGQILAHFSGRFAKSLVQVYDFVAWPFAKG